MFSEHEKENLVPSDKGIQMYRRRLRELIGALQDGTEPPHATSIWPNPLPTYGGDTVLTVPEPAAGMTASSCRRSAWR